MRAVEKHALRIVALVAIVAFAFWLAHFARESELVRTIAASYGYIGIFIISFISGFNLFVPIPAVSFLPLYVEAGLNFWVTLSIITIGVTAADSVAYLIGRLGRSVAYVTDHSRMLAYLDRWQTRYRYAPLVILFLYAALAPLPNELLLIPLGLMRCRLSALLPILIAGNALFNTLAAFGAIGIFDLLT